MHQSFLILIIWLFAFQEYGHAMELKALASSSNTDNAYYENSQHYEGWQKVASLDELIPNVQGIRLDDYHTKLKNILALPISDTNPNNGSKKKQEKKDVQTQKLLETRDGDQNIALLTMSFLIKTDNIYKGIEVPCFNDLLFFSGKSPRKEFFLASKEASDVDCFYAIDPSESRQPKVILDELKARFPKADEATSRLSPEIYQKHYHAELQDPKILINKIMQDLQYKQETPEGNKAIILDAVRKYKEDLGKLQKKHTHTHSEPKIIHYFEHTLQTIPAYWNFDIEIHLKKAIEATEMFVVGHQSYLWGEGLEDVLRTLHHDLLTTTESLMSAEQQSTPSKNSNPYDKFKNELNEFFSQNHQDTLTKAKEHLRELEKAFAVFTSLKSKNPLKLVLNDFNKIEQTVHNKLTTLQEILSRKPYRTRTELEADKEKIKTIKSPLPYQTGDAKTWIDKFAQFLPHISKKIAEEFIEYLDPNLKIDELVNILEGNEYGKLGNELKNADAIIALLLDPNTSAKFIAELKSILEKQGNLSMQGVKTYFSSLKNPLKNPQITHIYLHLHSYHDICENCAPSIARECEREDGFVQRLKSIILSYNHSNNPDADLKQLAAEINFKVLSSFSHLRDYCHERWTSPTFATPPDSRPALFYQMSLDPKFPYKA